MDIITLANIGFFLAFVGGVLLGLGKFIFWLGGLKEAVHSQHNHQLKVNGDQFEFNKSQVGINLNHESRLNSGEQTLNSLVQRVNIIEQQMVRK